jgi:pyruvate dehydrogenase (quinone)
VQEWNSESKRSAANVPAHSADLCAAAIPIPPQALLTQAAAVINEGSKVAILAGRGCLKSRDEVSQLARLVAGPIIKPLLGKAVVPDRDPYTTGGIGLLGTAPSQDAIQECDTLIIVGSSFPYLDFYPKPGKARAVQIDISPTRIGLRYPAEIGLVSDCASVLRALLPLINRKSDQSFIQTCQRRMQSWNELIEERGQRTDVPMKPQAVTFHLNRLLAADAIVSADSGTIATWAARYIEIRDNMQFSLSGTLATMANRLPYSIGAAVAYPNRQVVCIVGGVGLTMLMGELATLVKYRLNVKVVVFKNNTFGQIKWEQMVLEGNPEFGVELQPIDFAGIAMNCGAAGFTRALAHEGPAVVQAVVDPNEPPMPGNVSTDQFIKFSEAPIKGQKDGWKILKTVMKDKIREVV